MYGASSSAPSSPPWRQRKIQGDACSVEGNIVGASRELCSERPLAASVDAGGATRARTVEIPAQRVPSTHIRARGTRGAPSTLGRPPPGIGSAAPPAHPQQAVRQSLCPRLDLPGRSDCEPTSCDTNGVQCPRASNEEICAPTPSGKASTCMTRTSLLRHECKEDADDGPSHDAANVSKIGRPRKTSESSKNERNSTIA